MPALCWTQSPLEERNQRIFEMTQAGYKITDIARAHNITRTRVRQIRKKYHRLMIELVPVRRARDHA